jgi:hypothetical protein
MRREREDEGREGKERERGDDVVTLTREAHVGPMLTQLPREIKPDQKDIK